MLFSLIEKEIENKLTHHLLLKVYSFNIHGQALFLTKHVIEETLKYSQNNLT